MDMRSVSYRLATPDELTDILPKLTDDLYDKVENAIYGPVSSSHPTIKEN